MKILCPILLAAVCTSALAQSATTFMPEGSRDISVSAVAALVPRSEGSSQMRTILLPSATVQWSNGVFLEPGTLGMQLSEDGSMQYGPLLAYGVKNERRDNPDKQTRINLQPGAFFNYQLLYNLNLYSRLLYGGSDDNRGVLADVGATFSTPVAAHHTVSLSLGANFADHAYMQSYFGITAQQGRADRLPAYRAGGGLKSLYLSGSWNVELNTRYSLNSGVSVTRLGNSAANSPLTEQRHGYALYSALSYHF
jgi:outer membrane scaffolding protein for murein synthesis (MipA/OmpV family)